MAVHCPAAGIVGICHTSQIALDWLANSWNAYPQQQQSAAVQDISYLCNSWLLSSLTIARLLSAAAQSSCPGHKALHRPWRPHFPKRATHWPSPTWQRQQRSSVVCDTRLLPRHEPSLRGKEKGQHLEMAIANSAPAATRSMRTCSRGLTTRGMRRLFLSPCPSCPARPVTQTRVLSNLRRYTSLAGPSPLSHFPSQLHVSVLHLNSD